MFPPAHLPFAVHLSDGVLAAPWWLTGFALTALLALFGAWRITEDEVPRVALLTAAFFVASLIHVRVGPTSAHLLLNGLMGVVLGRRAALAIPVGVAMQCFLFGHGGLTAIGVNSCAMVLPALLAAAIFAGLRRLPWHGKPWFRTFLVAAGASLAGGLTVLATALLVCLVLLWGGAEDWPSLVLLVFLVHVPVAIVEAIILGFLVGFLARVKPEMLGWTTPLARGQPAADVAGHWSPNGVASGTEDRVQRAEAPACPVDRRV